MVSRMVVAGWVWLAVVAGGLGWSAEATAKPLQVFVLAGQSNMQGHANISTINSLADDPKTAPLLQRMRTADGTLKVCDRVWVSSIGCLGDAYSDLREQTGKLAVGFGAFGTAGERFGPEYLFGLTVEERLAAPILIIKTSWGGRSLHTDFRPPSGGPRRISDAMLAQWKSRGQDADAETAKIRAATGVFYRHMIAHVQAVLEDIQRVVPDYDPQQGYELAGFVWFQGWNDMVDGSVYPNRNQPEGYAEYAELLGHLIRDVRKDLSAPKLPVVIGVMGVGGEKEGANGAQAHFRAAQRQPATLAEFQGNVRVVETAPFWDENLDALKQRMDRVNNTVEQEIRKNPNLTREEKEAARQRAREEHFQPAELLRLKAGVSNGGYHYLGAAKIMAPIGAAFAEALLANGGAPAEPSTTSAQPLPPVKVFVLAGQSNMEGFGLIKLDPTRQGGQGSLEYLTKQPATAAKYMHLLAAGGEWAVREDVWIHYLERKGKLTVGFGARDHLIGPELGFGCVVGDAYEEPVLLVKLAWGGKSLAQDFRPPSSGGQVGPYYTEVVTRTKAVLADLKQQFPDLGDRGYVLAGFGWHQGWNDRVNQKFNDEYEKNMANFIRDIRQEFGVKNLPFVIAETGMGGPEEKHPRALSLMAAQAAVAEHTEFQGNVAFVRTRDFWRAPSASPLNANYHWNNNAETYYLIGEAMGHAMTRLAAAASAP